MDTYRYFTGQSQWAPGWLLRLPNFFMPIYQGDSTFKWLGVTISANSSFIGDTLFMHWRRQIKVKREHLAAGGGRQRKRRPMTELIAATAAVAMATFQIAVLTVAILAAAVVVAVGYWLVCRQDAELFGPE